MTGYNERQPGESDAALPGLPPLPLVRHGSVLALVAGLGSPPIPGSASAAVSPPIVHPVTPATTSVTTFVGFGTAAGNVPPGQTTPSLLNYGDFERGVTNPSSALTAAVYAFFVNGGTEAWLLLTTDETVPTLTSAMNRSFGPAAPERADLWTVPALGGFSGSDYDQVVVSLVSLATRATGLAVLEPPRSMIAAVVAPTT